MRRVDRLQLLDPRPPAEIPSVEAAAIHHWRHTRDVLVDCPFCGRRHVHGWPWGSESIGSRLSHCRKDRRPYSIWPPVGYVAPPTPEPRRRTR